jgi:hypothetical protein
MAADNKCTFCKGARDKDVIFSLLLVEPEAPLRSDTWDTCHECGELILKHILDAVKEIKYKRKKNVVRNRWNEFRKKLPILRNRRSKHKSSW